MTQADIALFRKIANGVPAAAELLDILFDILHAWDDLIDRDKPMTDADVNKMMFRALVLLPRNAFYRAHFDDLNPLVVAAIQNWMTATHFERYGSESDEVVAFVLRSSYVDIGTQVALITGGFEFAQAINVEMRLHAHAEGLTDYRLNLVAERAARGGV
jgi:hypothetical protein